MANTIYTKAKQSLLQGLIAFDADNIKAVLVDSALYTPNVSTDQYLSDIPAGARIATSANLTAKTVTDGVFDSGDVTFTAVTGDESEFVVLYKDTGVEATSDLLVLVDTATGLPVTPNGTDIIVQWDNGANKIFAL